ncbi:MAG: hypothetical protein IT269_12400 [Saprospiraceae bacterium]|nr:hypothetical protein [Saprospiraceae bacterium]
MYRFYLLLFSWLISAGTAWAQSNADCNSAMDICEKKTYQINKAGGEGKDTREADFISCFMNGDNHGQAEENSTWIRFEIAQKGTLGFAITPHRIRDDIDFVVYRLGPDGTCQSKKIVRCMAAGDTEESALTSDCMGRTGLRDGETESSEDAGCADIGDNAWLSPLRVEKGEKYLLLVSNVTSRGPGFSIDFYGTAMLPCDKKPTPKPDKPKPPKPEPKPKVEKPATPPVVIATPPPTTIGNRAVKVTNEVKVKSRDLKLTISDSQVEDGDIVSIFLDDKKVIDRAYLRSKPKSYQITIPDDNREHYLTIFADDFGQAEINTAKIVISDGQSEQVINLLAGRDSQESVKVVLQ